MFRKSGIGLCLLGWLTVWNLEACQTCADKGTIETREECRACKATGKVAEWKVRQCTACCGSGDKTRAYRFDDSSPTHSHGQGTFCRNCRGTGEKKEKIESLCGVCSGQGVLVKTIACPSCRGASASGREVVGIARQMPAVETAKVEVCTRCGSDGKMVKTIICDVCEEGVNHKKMTENGKDIYKCRSCGKTCDCRFVPCTCKKQDCPACGGKSKRTETRQCDVCGGDKIVTPLEKAKIKSSAMK